MKVLTNKSHLSHLQKCAHCSSFWLLQRNQQSSMWAYMSTASGLCHPSTWWVEALCLSPVHTHISVRRWRRRTWGLPYCGGPRKAGVDAFCSLPVDQLGLSKWAGLKNKTKKKEFVQRKLSAIDSDGSLCLCGVLFSHSCLYLESFAPEWKLQEDRVWLRGAKTKKWLWKRTRMRIDTYFITEAIKHTQPKLVKFDEQ